MGGLRRDLSEYLYENNIWTINITQNSFLLQIRALLLSNSEHNLEDPTSEFFTVYQSVLNNSF